MSALRHAVRRPGSPRVLIVDDDSATRAVLCAQLRPWGIECEEAVNGREAVRLARYAVPDLIILDISMPDLDGFQVVDFLRKERSVATPLLVYSGRDLTPAEREALTLGATRHLTTARVSEEEFMRTVLDLMRGLVREPEWQSS